MRSTLTPQQEEIIGLHQHIDLMARGGDLPFVSGWETCHGIEYEHLKPLYSGQLIDANSYTFMADDEQLVQKIRGFHQDIDGHFPDGTGVFLGAGSSPLLSSTMVLLSQLGAAEVCYIPPIYHAYYQLAKILRMVMTPIGGALTADGEGPTCALLPPRRTVLLITDPSWISGRSYSPEFLTEIRVWQERTGSTVIVDGTFQYTRWDAMLPEPSSILIPDQTFRLVCPTKSLCVHGVRCAYLLLPERLQEDLGWYYCKLVAATSQYDVGAAHLLLDQLRSSDSNRALVTLASKRYRTFRDSGLLCEVVTEPSCTYYSYGRLSIPLNKVLAMNGSYYELSYPEEFIRVNLLSSSLAAIAEGDFPGNSQ